MKNAKARNDPLVIVSFTFYEQVPSNITMFDFLLQQRVFAFKSFKNYIWFYKQYKTKQGSQIKSCSNFTKILIDY